MSTGLGTFTADEVLIRVVASGRVTTVAELSGTEPWQPRVLCAGTSMARVALVQTRASLLAGDNVRLRVSVGEEACLEVVEIGAMLIHDMRGGPAAVTITDIDVAVGGRLIWLGRPVIVSLGSDARRSVSARLADGGRILLGESVQLGRARHPPGSLSSHTRITHGGQVAVDETLETGDTVTLRSPVVAAAGTMVSSLTLAGTRDPAPPLPAMQAHLPATLWRSVGDAVWEVQSSAQLARHWRSYVVPGKAPTGPS